jgi:hypothetical protein
MWSTVLRWSSSMTAPRDQLRRLAARGWGPWRPPCPVSHQHHPAIVHPRPHRAPTPSASGSGSAPSVTSSSR